MKRIKNWIFGSLLVVMLAGGALAADFQKGWEAANAGDYATALAEFTPLAEAGDAYAQFALGAMYIEGIGVPQDFAEAEKWYRLAAEAGLAEAQYDLGVIYHNGFGVPQNFAEAEKWYRLAAEAGFPDAQNNLGWMYEFGWNNKHDLLIAYMWYNLAAAQGLELAKENRDKMTNFMSIIAPEDLAKAQEMAKRCLAQNYQGC